MILLQSLFVSMLGGEDLAGADVLAFASPWLGEGSGQGVTHHKLVGHLEYF